MLLIPAGVLLLLSIPFSCATASPGILEVDLSFPRNGSIYKPVSLIPVVFSVKGQALASLAEASIGWSVRSDVNSSLFNVGTIDLKTPNNSLPEDPYFVSSYLSIQAGIEGSWLFDWVVDYSRCSPKDGSVLREAYDSSFRFTTSNGAQPPTLETAGTSCDNAQNFAVNVTAVATSRSRDPNDPNYCAVLGENPTASLCAANVNASSAAVLNAAIHRTACVEGRVNCTKADLSSAMSFSSQQSLLWVITALGAISALVL
ncbi:uncharacterized protein K489DRAFT_366706 [Dissoconium aciculare CBS 342.82]|uniref:DUF7136 domain-containing protein n=1 Tax=Dissoconium aciculare CBS 342.82 TaxID=1314786 RepID=A0A6J3MI15_9PEZI|nr:uncharacterized protein K489DRAFT_366706 [Dissoconium aciculare CBS 342.82]KAF1827576.1 hypothetical protein K489DRAFT_366706 [Dissoconium aciculare CBS 342.82]